MKVWTAGVGGLILAGFLVAPTGASADRIYQGDDFSNWSDNGTRARICDREADGRGVHVDYRSTGGYTGRKDESGGADTTCEDSARMPDLGVVYQHRTVEEISGGFDAKSDWDTH